MSEIRTSVELRLASMRNARSGRPQGARVGRRRPGGPDEPEWKVFVSRSLARVRRPPIASADREWAWLRCGARPPAKDPRPTEARVGAGGFSVKSPRALNGRRSGAWPACPAAVMCPLDDPACG